jgi:hypothetical protein
MPKHEFEQESNTQKGRQNPAERIQRAVNPINTPIVCDECGSTYFYTAHAEQFAGGGYGSIEFRSITTSPQPIKVCLCGHPLVPKQASFGGSPDVLSARNSFYASAQAASERRKKSNPDKLVKLLATREDLELLQKSLSETLERVTARLDTIETLNSNIIGGAQDGITSGTRGPSPETVGGGTGGAPEIPKDRKIKK